MPWFKNHWKAKEGKQISASGLAEIAKTCDWITKLRVSAPLAMTNMAGGPLIYLAGALGQTLAVANEDIDACVYNSGSCTASMGVGRWTPGIGTVNLVAYNGTCLVENPNAQVAAINFSTTTGGIADGTLLWIAQSTDGYWYITQIDCGNP